MRSTKKLNLMIQNRSLPILLSLKFRQQENKDASHWRANHGLQNNGVKAVLPLVKAVLQCSKWFVGGKEEKGLGFFLDSVLPGFLQIRESYY